MTRFDPRVLANDPVQRTEILRWLETGLQAVNPERLTREALRGRSQHGPVVVIALGKAAPAMARRCRFGRSDRRSLRLRTP